MLHKITRFFSTIYATGAGLSLFAVFLVIFINSLRRYTFGKSVEWGEELPVFLAIYGIMFGMAWAYMQDRHVRFTILVDFIPDVIKNKLYMLVDLIMILAGGVLAYSGYLFAEKRGQVDASGVINLARDISSVTGLDWLVTLGKMYPYQISISIGGVMVAVAALLRLLNRVYDAAYSQPIESES